MTTKNHLCMLTRNRELSEFVRRDFVPDWRVTHCDEPTPLYSREIPISCVLAIPEHATEFQQVWLLPRELWGRELAIPVVVMLEENSHKWWQSSWETGLAGVIPVSVRGDALRAYVEKVVRRWQPLCNSAAGIWRFQRRAARLSPREKYVMERLVDGWWVKRIAHALGTSPHTVRNQRARLLEKLQMDSEKELMRSAVSVRWLQVLAGARGLGPLAESDTD